MYDYLRIIDRYYPEGSPLRDIYLTHCRAVAGKALQINAACRLNLDPDLVEAAAMLHDIGIFLCHAPAIHCNGKEHYLRHGMLGADLLRREGTPEEIARVAERHTGSGIDREDIVADDLPLPLDRCFMPQTTLERLICYADKFYSKSGSLAEKPYPKVLVQMSQHGPAAYSRFLALHSEFSTCAG